MGRTYESLDESHKEFIAKQRVFFVATAPLSAEGHVNLSPKGYDSLRVLGPKRVAYLDLTGSGAETIAHVQENGRIVLMWCAFEGPPKILRVHGRGRVAVHGSEEFRELRRAFSDERLGERAIIVVDADRVSTSCGYAVPHMRFTGERKQLDLWAEKKDLPSYRREKNSESIDGLPSLEEP